MDVAVIIPAQAWDAAPLAHTLDGVLAQRYDGGRVEVSVAQYGGGATLEVPASSHRVRFTAVDHASPYAARNAAAGDAAGDVLLFTEPGCVPHEGWVAAHVRAIADGATTLSVGRVVPARETWAVATFLAYENVRDRWVFSGTSWQHMFGRPKNMAIARHRFLSHGPFAEVIRGGDSKLVQRVARELSPEEVAFTPDAIVRQDDVRGLPSCLRDRFMHARAMRLYQSSHAAPIRLEDRIRIFQRVVAEQGHGVAGSIALLGFLASGIAAFRLGGASARFARRPGGGRPPA